MMIGNGKKWRDYAHLEDPYDRDKGYCYTAIHETEDGVLLGYSECTYKKNKFTIGKLIIRKI